jgi:hypothetical protein
MKTNTIRVALTALLIGVGTAVSGVAFPVLTIVDDGRSEYCIVLDADASPSERYAAEELQKFLKEISGYAIPILSSRAPKMIVVGGGEILREIDPAFDTGQLGKEGFTIRTREAHLILAGGKQRGTLYAVYTFLEDYLGCRWYSSEVSRIPRQKLIEIPSINVTHKPVLEYREPFYSDAFDGDWAARNKANGHSARLGERHGGKVRYSHFVHTFYSLVPPEKYFDEHPEYFALVNGERRRSGAQLCLTNPDVLRIVIEGVKRWIAQDPEADIYSVSQNDCAGWCECPDCKALDEREESHMGSLLTFVNNVAEAIEKEHPDKAIDTLAYQYTRKPPENIRPRHNVIIRLCSIECCFSHPLDSCPQNASFRDDILGWSKIAPRLYVWDYVTDFANYLLPFPNLDVLKPNIEFFVRHNVRGIFEEGNYSHGGGGEMAELRAYLLAKLLWNPDADVEALKKDFLEGHYGKAAGAIAEYIAMLHRKVKDDKVHLNIWSGPTSPYLTDEVLTRADALFDRAEKLADNAEILQRVLVARLPLWYVRITRPGLSSVEKLQLLEKFMEVVRKKGIDQIREGRPMTSWEQEMRTALRK